MMNPLIHIRTLSFCVAAILSGATLAQDEHPFLGNFDLAPGLNSIELDWTMIAGNTCQGIDILRSSDGMAFEVIGAIAGLCGSINEPVLFHFTDANPIEFNTLYYRLNLGSAGSSSIQNIHVEQVNSSDWRVYPSPMIDQATLALRVEPNAVVDVQVFDVNGDLVLEQLQQVGPSIPLHLPGAPAGTYHFSASAGDREFKGSFVKGER